MGLGSKHLIAGIVWLALMGIAYLAMDALTAPKMGVASSGNEIRVPRSNDGHFYVEGTINGRTVVFLIDTGATTTSVGYEVARDLRLGEGRAVTVGTANGATAGEEFRGLTIQLGKISIHRARLIALPGLGDKALLGQNVLQHLEIVQSADAMLLRPRDESPR